MPLSARCESRCSAASSSWRKSSEPSGLTILFPLLPPPVGVLATLSVSQFCARAYSALLWIESCGETAMPSDLARWRASAVSCASLISRSDQENMIGSVGRLRRLREARVAVCVFALTLGVETVARGVETVVDVANSLSFLAPLMLARSAAGPRAAAAADAPSEGPSVEDLSLPEHQIRDVGVRQLILLAHKVQELRVAVFGHFDDTFERLVTVGDAEGYPACVERFKARFAACDENLERVAMRLDALQQAPIGMLVRGVIRLERSRLDAKCNEQVLRQRLSVTDLESEERPGLKQRVQELAGSLAQRAAEVEEALEELRAEAADCDEDE